MKEAARNRQEDDTECNEITGEIGQLDIELARFHKAIADGVEAEAVAKPINERLDKKKALERRLLEIERERERALKLPRVTEGMVDSVLAKVHAMLEVTNPQELKTTLSHFVERIQVKGQELTLYYSVTPGQNVVYNWRPRWDLNPRSPP